MAFVYDVETLATVGTFEYDGEGWGLCFDGTDLVMSDGSAELAFRDPTDFSIRRTLPVHLHGEPLEGLNDLACDPDRIYANVFLEDRIAGIDSRTGAVVAWFDASELRERLPEPVRAELGVLNGLAHREEAGTFLVTGKLWPAVFEVVFVE